MSLAVLIVSDDLFIGAGATICYYTDCSPATVIRILNNGKKVIIQEDKYTRLDKNGLSESQQYSYESDSNGITHTATLRSDGKYRIMKSKTIVSIGVRRRYEDPSF